VTIRDCILLLLLIISFSASKSGDVPTACYIESSFSPLMAYSWTRHSWRARNENWPGGGGGRDYALHFQYLFVCLFQIWEGNSVPLEKAI
jgi:hypothetical protein